jgi:hypothetical protein
MKGQKDSNHGYLDSWARQIEIGSRKKRERKWIPISVHLHRTMASLLPPGRQARKLETGHSIHRLPRLYNERVRYVSRRWECACEQNGIQLTCFEDVVDARGSFGRRYLSAMLKKNWVLAVGKRSVAFNDCVPEKVHRWNPLTIESLICVFL